MKRFLGILLVIFICVSFLFIGYNFGISKTGSFKSILESSEEHHSPPSVIIEPGSAVETASYIIFKDDEGWIYAKNGDTGEIEFQGTDATQVMQSTIDALTNGGTIFIRKASTPYSLTTLPIVIDTEYIRITGDHPNITIPDNTMIRSTTNVATWAIFQVKASHVEIDHLIIDGNGDAQSYDLYWGPEEGLITVWKERWNRAALKSTKVEEDVKIHDCIIANGYFTSIAVNKFNKVKIYDNIIDKLHYSARVNIHMTWSNDTEIRNNFMDIASDWVGACNNIMIFPAGIAAVFGTDINSGSARITIENNVLWHCQDCPIEAQGGWSDTPNTYHRQLYIRNNIIRGASIFLSDSNRDSVVEGNLIALGANENWWNAGIAIGHHSDSNPNRKLLNILVHGNHITGNFTPYAHQGGIKVFSNGGVVQDVTISDNVIHDIGALGSSAGAGIRIDGIDARSPNHLTKIKLHGNKVYNMGNNGIRVLNTVAEAEITIEDNEIYNNGQYQDDYGIYIGGNGTFTIKGNNIYDDQIFETQDGGIYLSSSATHGRILSNRIESGSHTGLTIGTNNDNWFVDGNDFYGCSVDVDDNSGGTTVYGGNRNQIGDYIPNSEP